MASGNDTNKLAQSLQNTSLPAKPENESKDTAYKRTENVANTITVEKKVVSRDLLLDNKVENKDEAFGGAKPKRGNGNSDRQKTNSGRRREKQTFWYERQYSISKNKDREASKAEQIKDTRQKPTYSESTSFAYENSERRNSASKDKGNFLDKRIPIKADVTKLEGSTKTILHRTQLLNERIEESLYDSGVRMVMKEGGEVADLLMTDIYRACNIKENASAAKSLTKEEVHNVLSQYGSVEQICHTAGKKDIFWGKVTFTNESDAKAAVICFREEADRLFTLVPITFSAYRPIQQQEITMKLSWTRRQGKGICYVCCNRTEDVSLLLRSKITVLDEVVTTRLSKHRQGAKPSDICIRELTLTVSEEDIKGGLANALGDENTTDRFNVFIPREKCTLRTNEFELVQKELTGLLSKLSKPGAFQLYVREYKEQTVTAFALATFNDADMCKDVAHKINGGYGYISGCKVRAEVEYKASVHVTRFLFDLLKEDITEKVEMYRTLCRSTTVEIRLLISGNYSLDIKSTSLQNLAKAKVSLDKLVQGEELNGDAIHNIQALFTADNRATKMRIEKSTDAIIIMDERRTQITVQGSTTAKDRAVELIRREVLRCTNSKKTEVRLKGEENCDKGIVARDFNDQFRNNRIKLSELVQAAMTSFVIRHNKEYKFCPTPNCNMEYKVSNGRFECGLCHALTCTKCHNGIHEGLNCDMYENAKKDRESVLRWIKEDPMNRKMCPFCNLGIEKIVGINHMTCRCGTHICWKCFKYFSTPSACVEHLRTTHSSFV